LAKSFRFIRDVSLDVRLFGAIPTPAKLAARDATLPAGYSKSRLSLAIGVDQHPVTAKTIGKTGKDI